MVRTRDTSGTKAVGAKAPRKVTGSTSSAGSSASASLSDPAKNKYSGGNPYFPRETPAWQKPITAFFASGQGECSQKENNSRQVNVDQNCTMNSVGVEPTNDKPACGQIGDNATDGEEIKKMDGIVEVGAIGTMEEETGIQNLDNAQHGSTTNNCQVTIENKEEACGSGDDKMIECAQMDSELSKN